MTGPFTFGIGGFASTASGIANVPAGNISATNVQAAINELDTEKVAKAGDTMTGTLNITPAAASLTRGINITQTGPTAGAVQSVDVAFNQILINSEAVEMACVAGVSENVTALQVSHTFGGTNAKGQRAAGIFHAFMSAASAATNPLKIYSGLASIFSGSANDGGTDTSTGAAGRGIGHNANAILSSGATNWFSLDGEEINYSVRTGASLRIGRGLAIIQYGDHAVSGAEIDAGLVLVNQSGAVGWATDGIRFDSSQSGSGTLFKSTAYLMKSYGAESITGGFDFTSFTFSGNAMAFPGFTVTGNGRVVVNPSSVSYTPASTAMLTVINGAGSSAIISRAYGGAATITGGRANGSAGSETSPTSGQNMFTCIGQGWSNGDFNTGGQFAFGANENWSSTARGTFLNTLLVPNGSTTQQNALTVRTTGLSMANNLFVDGDGVSQMRAYTVATLPAAASSTGKRAYVTNSNAALTAGIGAVVAGGGANIVPVFCDGTNWRIG